MYQDAILPSATFSKWAGGFARMMRLDEPPAIEPLPDGYKTTRALPFLFDIVRAMLMGRALLVLAAAIISQVLFSLQPYGLAPLLFI
jgi:hypothetical protein